MSTLRDALLVGIPTVGGFLGARMSVKSAEKNVQGQIDAAEKNALREHRREQTADRESGFVEYLGAHQGMVRAARRGDVSEFQAAQRDFDRATARVRLLGASRPDLATAMTRIDILWMAVTLEALETTPEGEVVNRERLATAANEQAFESDQAERAATDAFRDVLVRIDPTNMPP